MIITLHIECAFDREVGMPVYFLIQLSVSFLTLKMQHTPMVMMEVS